MDKLQASFARVETKVNLLVNKRSFASGAASDGINAQLLELDIGDNLGVVLQRLEHESQRFEMAFTSALSRSTSEASSSQARSLQASPIAITSAEILEHMRVQLEKLQRKAELSSTYQRLIHIAGADDRDWNSKICVDAVEDVRDVSRRFRRLCVELKESVTSTERAE